MSCGLADGHRSFTPSSDHLSSLGWRRVESFLINPSELRVPLTMPSPTPSSSWSFHVALVPMIVVRLQKSGFSEGEKQGRCQAVKDGCASIPSDRLQAWVQPSARPLSQAFLR